MEPTVPGGTSAIWENRKREVERVFYEKTQPFADVVRARLREERKARGLTQAQLAAAMTEADAPMDHTVVSNIERGKRPVPAEELFAFANVLDVPLVRLVSPLDGEPAARFGGIGLDRHEVGNWLIWGEPSSREAMTGRWLMRLMRQIATMRQVVADELDPSKRLAHSKTLRALLDELRRVSRIRPGVMERQALRDAMQDAPDEP
jgi:transcriptional regulator with XRE-family HTH domain